MLFVLPSRRQRVADSVMSTAPNHHPRYTVADYQQWPGDWELWEGAAIAMTPSPFGRHQAVAARLVRLLGNELENQRCDTTVIAELDWIVCDDTVVRPDVMVVCGGPPERHLETPPALVAEILSPATRNNDLVFKRQLYASEGVPYYLIVDPDANRLDRLTLRETGDYVCSAEAEIETLRLCDRCDVRIDGRKLFG